MRATTAPAGTRSSLIKDRSAAGSDAMTRARTDSPVVNSTVMSSIAWTTWAAVMTLPSVEMRTPEPISLKRTEPPSVATSRPLALITTTETLAVRNTSPTVCADTRGETLSMMAVTTMRAIEPSRKRSPL
jgi:hypothetical protein